MIRAVVLTTPLALSVAVPARADGVRYDSCTTVGEDCHNAAAGHLPDDPTAVSQADAVKSGTCQDAKCQRGGPDGTIVFDCHRCIEGAGAGDDDDDSGCSCRTTGPTAHRALAAVMGLVGIAALGWSRRRRR